jgi:uncharacterized protein
VPVLTTLPLLTALVGGVGWHYSSLLLRPARTILYPDLVREVRPGLVWLGWSERAGLPGRWALRWAEGMVIIGDPVDNMITNGVSAGNDHRDGAVIGADGANGAADAAPNGVHMVCRPVLTGALPPPGTPVILDAGLFDPDPGAHGLAFDEVVVHSPVGPCPAWLVPGPAPGPAAGGDTWVVAVHGRGADRRECLRALPELHRQGFPVLAISYRNDVDAPPSPDGHYHLGDTEWEDLEAAVRYALDHGARRVVLYGWSMGAAVCGAFLDRSALADRVAAVVWDAPVLDWRATLRAQAELRGMPFGVSTALPALLTAVARRRIGIDFDRFDLVRRPPGARPPTLLFHGTRDTAVPIGPARALAARAAGLDWPLRYVEVEGAEHTAAWNVDPEAYGRALAAFLRPVAPAPVDRP